MSAFNVIHLGDGLPVDMAGHMAGAWGEVQVLAMVGGDSRPYGSDDADICLYVIDGTGTITMDDHVEPLSIGKAITITMGSYATVESAAGIELFTAVLPVVE